MIDSHIHLTDYEPNVDLGDIIQRAQAAGVSLLVNNSTGEHDWQRVLDLSREHCIVYPCIGVHPWFASQQSDEWLLRMEELIAANDYPIGEIGLDRNVEPRDDDAQEKAFCAQLDLARRYNRPVMIHCVRAWGAMMDILRSQPPLPRGMLFHAFGGSQEMIKPLADMGAYFSFSGTVLYSTHSRARKAILRVPLERLLIETDSPNMIPPNEYRQHGHEVNTPANLPAICEGIASHLGIPSEELAEIATQNALRFLNHAK